MRRTFAFAIVIASLMLSNAACSSSERMPRSADAARDRSDLDLGTPQWRPALHYSPRRNWMNDPNGLVYHQGRYHLFYQYNPQGNYWGEMSWGHATSRDLLHWQEQPLAMAATGSEQIFSGSIVVDANNSSGLGTAQSPPLVALYTSAYRGASGHDEGVQAQSLAYSTDDGTTWRKYGRNPVLTLQPESRQFRDPKVSWYAPGGYWLLAAVVADARVVKFYRSHNLIDWEFLSDFGPAGVATPGVLWEMPDLFPLPLDGDARWQKWVLIVNINPGGIAGGSGAQYFVGNFDGKAFTAEYPAPTETAPERQLWLDYGADYYATGTYANAPRGEAIAIGWMSNWDYAERVPTTPWKGAMALPRRLELKTVDGVPRLTFAPVPQVQALVREGRGTRVETLALDAQTRELAATTRGTVQHIALTLHPRGARQAGLIVRASADRSVGTRIYYDAAQQQLVLDRSRSGIGNFAPNFSQRHAAPLPLRDGALRLGVVVDRGSVEVFDGDGRAVISDLIFPSLQDDRVFVFADGGGAEFSDLVVTDLSPKR